MIRAIHYTAAALFVAPILAHATGLTGGTEDPHVARWIAEDVIADDRSALNLNGQGVRFVGQEGRESERQETPTPVPVPPAMWLMLTLLVAGWFCGVMDNRARRRRMGR